MVDMWPVTIKVMSGLNSTVTRYRLTCTIQPLVVPLAVPPFTLTTATFTNQSVLFGCEMGFELIENVAPSRDKAVGRACQAI